MHLGAEELVDIAEGTSAESSAPHLAACDACRAQLHEMRSTMAAVQNVDVPEPSPLFWDHLSRRIGEAVAEDPAGVGLRPSRYMVPAWFAVAAVLALAVVLGSRAMAPAPLPDPATAFVAAAPPAPERADDVTTDDDAGDAALTLVASLAGNVDVDTVREAGLAARDSAEHAVTHMSAAELQELRRLLTEEMKRSGA